MKRGLIFLIILLSIIGLSNEITGKSITSKDIQAVSINITISAPPTLEITNPKNNTYLTNTTLPLTFTTDPSTSSIWYNLDNGNNISITNSKSFNTSVGNHILYLFANNSDGETGKNVTFFINLTRINIIYSEYNGSLKKTSTNFINFSYEDIQNVSNPIFENAEFGKIEYNTTINITNDENPSDNTIDLNTNTNISFNRIEINSTALPNFNTTSTLSLYNLTFSNPRILKDGAVCSSSICTKESFSGGTLKFNVTGFSVYSAEETPSEASTESSVRSGGGGTSSAYTSPDLIINPITIRISSSTNEIKTGKIELYNNGDKAIDIELDARGLKKIIKFNEKDLKFTLRAGEERIIEFDVISPEKVGIYNGKILVNGKEILIILEVNTKEILFDIKITIPDKFKIINTGDKLVSQVNIIPIEDKKLNVTLIYSIRDFNGKTFLTESEAMLIKSQIIFKKEFSTTNLKPGNYILTLELVHPDGIIASSDNFEIKENISVDYKTVLAVLILGIIILIISIINTLHKRYKRHKMHKKK